MKKLLIFSGFILITWGLKQQQSNLHTCPFNGCPYKGITFEQYELSCIAEDENYTEPASDAQCIDALHFLHPSYSYDQLDSLLFTPISKK